MDIEQSIRQATHALQNVGIHSARLDVLILLEDLLGKDRTWLLAHPETALTDQQSQKFAQLLARRARREPLAYMRGKTEFYGRNFAVSPDVLIPRPETEQLIEAAISLKPKSIVDVGTGSGAIATTLALELPNARVEACDTSPGALKSTAINARQLNAPVHFFASDLLEHAKAYDLIIANLPYVDPSWECSPEVAYEPPMAVFAPDGGLALIKKLIQQAPQHLTQNGHLLLEADPRQHAAISNYANNYSFSTVRQGAFVVLLRLP